MNLELFWGSVRSLESLYERKLLKKCVVVSIFPFEIFMPGFNLNYIYWFQSKLYLHVYPDFAVYGHCHVLGLVFGENETHLKYVEVDGVVMRLCADDPRPAGIPHHHVRVRTRRDDAFPDL